ncbi:MAG TPA: 50S ribosomal protein L17 [Candidatus Moranbacteria bacterium]|nr:50S ribosomal protein L17 [Candidatus Moranbacteria bacterium]
MRHQKHGRKFGRVKNQRRALFRTMLGSFIMREKITTTEAKAKELKSRIDKIINKAKKAEAKSDKVAIRRDLGKLIPEMAVKKITGEFLKAFSSRNSGYARVIKIERRKNDGAKMAVVEFV